MFLIGFYCRNVPTQDVIGLIYDFYIPSNSSV